MPNTKAASCAVCKVERGYRPMLDYVVPCALHAAAPGLLQALRVLTSACIPSVASQYGTRMPKREEVDAALEAIRKAESK